MTLEVIRKGNASDDHPIPLLFIHGAWHGAWCWDEYFLDYFADLGYECVAPSVRGHGKSPGVERMNRYRIADYVADVAAVAATLATPPIVIGHSMGGFIAQHFLARYPATAGVLLASVPPAGVRHLMVRICRQHPRLFLAVHLRRNLRLIVDTPNKVREVFYSAGTSQEDVERFTARLTTESYRGFMDMFMLDLPKRGSVKVPLKIMGGELDNAFPPKRVEATARFYDTTATIYRDTAHNMMVEPRWREIADDIDTWIQSAALSRTGGS